MKKILIVKTSALGDITHLFPTVEYLKRKFPDSQLHWVVEKSFSSLIEAHPYVDRVIKVETKKWRKEPFALSTWREIGLFRKELRGCSYDLLFDFQGNSKSALIVLAAKAAVKIGFGLRSAPEWPNCLSTNRRYNPPAGKNIREDYLSLVQQFCKDELLVTEGRVALAITQEQRREIEAIMADPKLTGRRKVLVCPGAAWPNKQLNAGSMVLLLEHLLEQEESAFLIAWGSEKEREFALGVSDHFSERALVIPKLALPSLQALMEAVDLVVSMDSFPLQLAGTTKTPTLSVFGPSNAEKYMPMGEGHCAIQGPCPYGVTFEKRCPKLRTCKTGACLKEIDLERALSSLKRR